MSRMTMRVAMMLACLGVAAAAMAASLTEQRRELSRASTAVRTAERMARAKRHDEAAVAVAEAQEALTRVADGLDDRMLRSFERTQEKLAATHAKLTAQGVQLPKLSEIKPSKPSPAPSLGAEPGASRGDRVSFVEQVVPILNSRCGGCHVQGNRGDVSFANYASLTEGVPSGRYVEVGSGMESLLVSVIANGQMPPNGAVVTPQETRALLTWINQGAAFDGDDPQKPLAQLIKAGGPATPTSAPAPIKPGTPPVAKPKGDETVSFALDLAPLIVKSCNDCHGETNARAGFSVASFQQFWQGGSSGPAVVPGDAAASLLVQKLRGTAEDGARMPQNRPAWKSEQIELVERWIREGASFDGGSTTESLGRMAALAKASHTTPEQLSAERARAALTTWRLAIPDEDANQANSEHFLAVGNLPETQLSALLREAEMASQSVAEFFNNPDKPLNKARVTMYVFAKRIDYSEFGTMVERRSLPTAQQGHVQYDLVNPYIALTDSSEIEKPNQRLLATMLASLWVADRSEGRLPTWLTDGAGKAVAARLHKDERTQRWRDEVPAALATISSPDDFMTGKAPPEVTGLLAFGFADALLKKPANFHRLIQAAAEGAEFEDACQQVFKHSPKELAQMWVASQQRGR